MKKLLILVFILLFCGQAWSDQDTLQPVADQTITWDHTGCSSPFYQCVDDPPGSPDSTITYAHTITANNPEFYRVDTTFAPNIDSVVVHVNARKDGYADSTVYLYMGFGLLSVGEWIWWTTDSVLLTAIWANYSENLTYEPDWTYQKINARRFGARSAYANLSVADTLFPTADGGAGWCSGWSCSGCDAAEHYDCVNDAPGSPDGDATRTYVADDYVIDCFDFEDATLSGTIDSVVLRANAKRTGDASALSLGFLTGAYAPHWEGSVDLTTSYADYSVTSTEDENSQPWTNANINAKKWAYGTAAVTNNRTVTQFFIIVYYTTQVPSQMTQVFTIVYYTEAEGGKPIKNIMKRGIVK